MTSAEVEPSSTGWSPSPARRYSWAPFVDGNAAAFKSGAHSARFVDPLAVELAEGLIADQPGLARYPEVVMAWGRAEARCALLADWTARVGLIDELTGELRGGKHIAQFERLASDLRARLGLDPRSEAELSRERVAASRGAVDLDAIVNAGKAALDSREPVAAPLRAVAAPGLPTEPVGASQMDVEVER